MGPSRRIHQTFQQSPSNWRASRLSWLRVAMLSPNFIRSGWDRASSFKASKAANRGLESSRVRCCALRPARPLFLRSFWGRTTLTRLLSVRWGRTGFLIFSRRSNHLLHPFLDFASRFWLRFPLRFVLCGHSGSRFRCPRSRQADRDLTKKRTLPFQFFTSQWWVEFFWRRDGSPPPWSNR